MEAYRMISEEDLKFFQYVSHEVSDDSISLLVWIHGMSPTYRTNSSAFSATILIDLLQCGLARKNEGRIETTHLGLIVVGVLVTALFPAFPADYVANLKGKEESVEEALLSGRLVTPSTRSWLFADFIRTVMQAHKIGMRPVWEDDKMKLVPISHIDGRNRSETIIKEYLSDLVEEILLANK